MFRCTEKSQSGLCPALLRVLWTLRFFTAISFLLLFNHAALAEDTSDTGNPDLIHKNWEDTDSAKLLSWSQVNVPKDKKTLRLQLGPEFQVVRRGEFLIASDLDSKRFDYLINGVFACCREIMGREFFKRKPTKVVTVYIFKDRNSYTNGLKKNFGMDPISPYGHYGHKKRYIVVNYSTGPGTLVHEMTHALMAEDFPVAPIWISEGMASLYEQCRVENDSIRGEQNWRLPELKKTIAQNGHTPLPELFASNTKVFRMMRESLNYAQSRYFCLYLEEQGLLRKLYARFRDTAKTDPTGVKAIEYVCGKDITTVEREWREWVLKQKWVKPK